MSLQRIAAKRDRNEPEIIDGLIKAGRGVQQLSAKGVPDLLVSGEMVIICPSCFCPIRQPNNALIEVKFEKGKLTPDQVEWHSHWREHGGQVDIARTIEEAIAIVEGEKVNE